MHTATNQGVIPDNPEHPRLTALVRQSTHAVCIFADPSLTAFTLVGAEVFAVPEGMQWVGAVGLVDGWPKTVLTEPFDGMTAEIVSTACVSHLAAVLERCLGLQSRTTRADA